MAGDLPDLSLEEFAARLPEGVSPETAEALWCHFRVLRRWNRSHALIAPGEAEVVVERHYAESLLGVRQLSAGVLLDVGSGAGFPGFVLAAAVPGLEVHLLEPRGKKVAFLRAAARRSGVAVNVVSGRLPPPEGEGAKRCSALPESLDFVSLRALKLSEKAWRFVLDRLAPKGRILLWSGRELPFLPEGLAVIDELPIPGSELRRIVVAGRVSAVS